MGEFDQILFDARSLEVLLHSMELPAQRLVAFAKTLNASEYDVDFLDWLEDGRRFVRHFVREAERRGFSPSPRRRLP